MAKSTNAIRFGINPRGMSYEKVLSVAKTAEDAGFEVISFSDRPPEPSLEGWTFATAIAVQTKKIAVTHSTLNVPLRNPALLAKMASSLDVMTGGGRVILTLGAGGQEAHYTAIGTPFGTAGERVTDLEDAISIMRGLWANEIFSYEGRQFSVTEASSPPKPLGTIPFIIGAGGARMLKYTGAKADGWIKNGGWPETHEQYLELLGQVEAGAEEAGRDPRTIRRVLNGTGYIGDKDPNDVIPETMGRRGGLMGNAARILEIIDEYVELGVDTFQLQFPGDMVEDQLKQFGAEVIAKVKR
jgi:alkanesulfonate monooxygenase SsuD/methylene tetrahydromethanopterin reductase-like flavin-dependent oxidoreductase (luciferase family)